MRPRWRQLPRRRDVVVPLRLVALLGLGLSLPSFTGSVLRIAEWATTIRWEGQGSGGYFSDVTRALDELRDMGQLPTLWFYACVSLPTVVCLLALFHERTVWYVLRRIPP